jgi:hypothetical protein
MLLVERPYHAAGTAARHFLLTIVRQSAGWQTPSLTVTTPGICPSNPPDTSSSEPTTQSIESALARAIGLWHAYPQDFRYLMLNGIRSGRS